MSYYAYATKKNDPCSDAECENHPAGALGTLGCKISKGVHKQVSGECTALDPKKLAAEDKKKTEGALKPEDKDCANYGGVGGILDGFCVAGKSITKGGQGAGQGLGGIGDFLRNLFGGFGKDPRLLLLIAGVVVFVIFIVLKKH